MITYTPEKLVDIALEKLYRHSYCLIDSKDTRTISSTLNAIQSHESFSKYRVVQVKVNAKDTKIILVGKPSYSF